MKMEARETQLEELNVIESIYPDLLFYDGENRIKLMFEQDIRLTIDLPENYPKSEPPIFELSGPCLSGNERLELFNALNECYIENMGMPVLFSWIALINDFVQKLATSVSTAVSTSDCECDDSSSGIIENVANVSLSNTDFLSGNEEQETLEIFHGEVFSDRKSHFQAHLCHVFSKKQVEQVMRQLLSNNKISRATHNIFAWRIRETRNGKEFRMHDCEDDGETGASSKMLDLLDKMGAENVIVVVTRWYGGIHLGPDRFRHINNLSREILAQNGFDKRNNNK